MVRENSRKRMSILWIFAGLVFSIAYGLSIPPQRYQMKLVEAEPEFSITGQVDELEKITLFLRDSLQDISSTNVPPSDIDRMALLIYDSLTAPSRFFHSPDHIFSLAEGMNPIQTLAVLFHDIIYYSVDGGLSETQYEILNDVIVEDKIDGSVRLRNADEFRRNDSVISMVLSVFGFQPGQLLKPYGGMNEFLSAVVAGRNLEQFISKKDLLRIVGCIEVTIPFRSFEGGISLGDVLFKKLQNTNEMFQAGMDESELIGATHLAIELGNRDVENFSCSNADDLVANSWPLMSEANLPLRDLNSGAIMLSDLATAINKMRLFYENLKPEAVNHHFKGIPTDADYNNMLMRISDNVGIGKKYMECYFLFASFMVALSITTGGDSPVSIWEIDKNILDKIQVGKGPRIDRRVLDQLIKSISYEIPNLHSTITPHLYILLGDEGVISACKKVTTVPVGEKDAKEFLDVLPRQAVNTLILSLSKSGSSARSEALTKLAADYLD